jgi:hypothetical protein
MRTLYNLPDGDVEDINQKVASQIFDDDQPNKSYLTISQVGPFSSYFLNRSSIHVLFRSYAGTRGAGGSFTHASLALPLSCPTLM